MTFEQVIQDNVLILRLTGDLIGEDNGARLLDRANTAMQEGVRTCIVDISGVRYINSSGIGVLIALLTKFRNKEGEVYLMKPSETVQKLLVITKLNSIFRVIQTEEEILKTASK